MKGVDMEYRANNLVSMKRDKRHHRPLRSFKELAAELGVIETVLRVAMTRNPLVPPPKPIEDSQKKQIGSGQRYYDPKEFQQWWAAEQLAKMTQPPGEHRATRTVVKDADSSVVSSSDLPGSNIVIISPEMDALNSEEKKDLEPVPWAREAIDLGAMLDSEAQGSRLDGAQLERAAAPSVSRPLKQRTPGARIRVYQAVVDLTNQHRPASRKLIAQMTGFKLSMVDDHVKNMKNDGLLSPVVDGVVEPVEHFPLDRPISITELPSGMVKYEIGDDVLELTPSEARRTGRMMGGFAQDAHVIRGEREGRSQAAQVAHLERQLWHAERRLADLMSGRVPLRKRGGVPVGQR